MLKLLRSMKSICQTIDFDFDFQKITFRNPNCYNFLEKDIVQGYDVVKQDAKE